MTQDKKWILINSAKRELQRVLNWTTSIDDYGEDLRDALRLLDEVQEKIMSEIQKAP
jgi:TolB-like protein